MYKLNEIVETDIDVQVKCKRNIEVTDDWINFSSVKELPISGWKIHVSTIPDDFKDAFNKIYEYCLKKDIYFKIPKTNKAIKKITFGGIPFIQTGKVFTLYIMNPNTLEQHLKTLNKLLKNIKGPIIPSDKKYSDSNCLYYRYGSFKSNYSYDNISGLKYDYYIYKQQKILDIRKPNFYKPKLINDPVSNSNKKDVENLFVKKNINIIKVITQKAKGGVYKINYNGQKAIMKEARPFVLYENNLDAIDRLRNEYNILKLLESKVNFIPHVYDFFEYMGNHYLIMEFIEGQSLEEYIDEYLLYKNKDINEILTNIKTLESYLKKIHNMGIVLRDMSPFNIILTNNGIKLIDFEISYSTKYKEVYTGYTPGFVPVRSYMENRINYSYDYFALGSICIYISTGLKAKYDDVDTFELLQKVISVSINSVETDNSEEVCILGIKYINILCDVLDVNKLEYNPKYSDNRLLNYNEFSRSLHEMINYHYKEIVISNNDIDLNNSAKNFWPYSLNYGYGGLMYFYMNVISNRLESEKSKAILEKLIESNIILKNSEDHRNIHPSLYFGEGILPLILILAEKYNLNIGNKDILKETVMKIQEKLYAHDAYSISHGKAGAGLVLIKLFKLTQDDFYLNGIKEINKSILKGVKYINENDPYWPYYSFDTINKKEHEFLGFSHGTVGVGYYLCEYYKVCNDTKVLNMLQKILNSLYVRGISVNNSLFWENRYNDKTIWPHWCNGSAGILQFLNNYIQIFPNSEKAQHLIKKGVEGLINSNKFDSHSYCHGIAGHTMVLIEILNSKHTFLENDLLIRIKRKILNNLSILSTMSIPDNNHFYVWLLEDDKTVSFSLMTGYLGIYLAFMNFYYDLDDILY